MGTSSVRQQSSNSRQGKDIEMPEVLNPNSRTTTTAAQDKTVLSSKSANSNQPSKPSKTNASNSRQRSTNSRTRSAQSKPSRPS